MSKRGGKGRNQGRKPDFEGLREEDSCRIKVPTQSKQIIKDIAREVYKLGIKDGRPEAERFLERLKPGLAFFEDLEIPASFGKTDVITENYTLLNLNQFVTEKNSNSINETFLAKVTGDSMIEAGIFPGDLLVVEVCNQPNNRDIVVARINDTLTVKRYHAAGGIVQLLPESTNPQHEPIAIPIANQEPIAIPIANQEVFEIVGIVRHVVHNPKNRY